MHDPGGLSPSGRPDDDPLLPILWRGGLVITKRFCPACGASRIEGGQFCGMCGSDLDGSVAPAFSLAEPVGATTRAAAPSGQHRGRLGAIVAGVSVLGVMVLVVAVVVLKFTSGAADVTSVIPESRAVVLTSPVPAPPDGLADPDTPAFDPDTGFTPDAMRVLTVTVLRLSLEEYRAATGVYPPDLAALFPGFAPLGPDGTPMTGPPPADGYGYEVQGDGYALSVRLESGQTYVTAHPTGP